MKRVKAAARLLLCMTLVIGAVWIRRGDQLVLIEELKVGNYVQARAAKIAGSDQATNIDVLTTP